jgi:hypothetical protein
MPQFWTFRTYVSARGVAEVQAWYDAQSPRVQAAFDQRLRTLQQMTIPEWLETAFGKKLKGECAGLWEIRFKAERVQHRPLGWFGPSSGEFTVLLCAREIGDKFDPPNACKIALGRKNEANYNARSSRGFTVD